MTPKPLKRDLEFDINSLRRFLEGQINSEGLNNITAEFLAKHILNNWFNYD